MKSKLLTLLILTLSFSLSGCDFLELLEQGDVNNYPSITREEPKDPEEYIDPSGGEEEPKDPVEPSNPEPSEPGTPIDPVVLSSISVTSPNKTIYETGDELDLAGLVVSGHYSDGNDITIDNNLVSLSGYDMNVTGDQTVTVTFQEKTASFKITVNRKYDEEADSLEGIDASDMSDLYSAFTNMISNYTTKTESYFNSNGAYDYYRHYHKNYVQEKVNIYTNDIYYSYPLKVDYLGVLNNGLLNLNNNYYSYSLSGETLGERLSSSIKNDDLELIKENSNYQDDLFGLEDLDEQYFVDHSFMRVSKNKYESSDSTIFNDFIAITAPYLINEGSYMTFSKVTIELNPLQDVSFRIRLFASKTQSGKLLDLYKDKTNRPNWYLLFSEALVYDVGSTLFTPANEILKG